MRENSVVFPAPLSPSSAVKEPAGTVRLTPSSARRAPKAWLTPSTLSAASSELSLGCKGGLRSGRASLSRRDRHTPGIAADRDRLHHAQAVCVDHRDIAGHAVGREQQLAVGPEGQVPDALPDQEVFFHLIGLAV